MKKRKGDWIGVENPPDLGGGRYLVWTRNAGVEICRWSEKRQKWMGGAWTAQITHWMPLPKSPDDDVSNLDTGKER